MYKLTDRRLKQAQEILDRYRKQLFKSKRIDPGYLEKELRDCWGLGYQTLKGVMIDMLKHDDYRLVAAYYMQYQNPTGVVSEFQPSLRKLYDTKAYEPGDRDEKVKAFWAKALK